jgi:hypothetical protein
MYHYVLVLIPPTNPSYTIGPDDLFQLVFFSTFEELNVPMHGSMKDAGVLKFYDPSPIPCLYMAPVANVLGRVPLIPLFLAGSSTPTIPHKFSKNKGSGFPMGTAGTADAEGRRGSNVYEVNTWLWNLDVHARQAPPGRYICGGDCPEEKSCARGSSQAIS